jgi:hypothetical protein
MQRPYVATPMDLGYVFAALWFLAIGVGGLFLGRDQIAIVLVEQPADGRIVLHAYELASSEVRPPSADEVFRKTIEPGWASRALSWLATILGAATGIFCLALVLPGVRDEFPQVDDWLRALFWLVLGLAMLPLSLRPLLLAPQISKAIPSQRRDRAEGTGELVRATADSSVKHGAETGLLVFLLGQFVRRAPTGFLAWFWPITAACLGIGITVAGIALLPVR